MRIVLVYKEQAYVGVLATALKVATKKIDDLEQQNKDLQSRLEDIESRLCSIL